MGGRRANEQKRGRREMTARKQLNKQIADEHLIVIEDDPLVDDVMSGEAEIGYFIAAMQRAGIDWEKIAETLERLSEAYSMPPHKSIKICREFRGQTG
jgi:hypothetical protein